MLKKKEEKNLLQWKTGDMQLLKILIGIWSKRFEVSLL